MKIDLDDYAYLWDGTDPGWVLWYLPVGEDADDLRNFSVFNKNDRTALLVDDEDLAATLVGEMRRRCAEVITGSPT